jgi:phosphate uptake regulator
LNQPFLPPSLDELDLRVRGLIVHVGVGVERATAAYVTGDLQELVRLGESDREAERVLEIVESSLERAPAFASVPNLVSALLVLPHLQRAFGLVIQIAARARCGPVLPPAIRSTFRSVGAVAQEMWEHVGEGWSGAGGPQTEMDRIAETLANLCRSVYSSVTSSQSLDPHHATEALLVAHFYNQLGEEAVSVAPRARLQIPLPPH